MSTIYVLSKDGKPLMPNFVHKETAWQEKLAEEKVGFNKKYGALNVLNQIIPALTDKLSVLFPKHFFVTTGKSTHDYRETHGVSKDHWLDAYCIACSVLPNNACDSNINNHVPYELKQFRRHDRRALHKANTSRACTLNGKSVETNRHKAIKQTMLRASPLPAAFSPTRTATRMSSWAASTVAPPHRLSANTPVVVTTPVIPWQWQTTCFAATSLVRRKTIRRCSVRLYP